MIAVLDYGIGNLRSAEKALQVLGADARLVTEIAQAEQASGIVLPGVGAFGACADALRASGLDAVVYKALSESTPFLGICVGFQLLFARSEESPATAGLGVLPGEVRRLRGREKLPQMQWNTVRPSSGSTMFGTERDEQWFYFVHSYAPVVPVDADVLVSRCEYGESIVCAVETEHCWGVQFHPEKSGRDGLALLQRFIDRCQPSTSLGRD